MPETSIVIRTFNEEKNLGNLLIALQKQSYRNFEVIIVDSGSNDGTLRIAEEHKTNIIKIESRDFTFGYSLNVGCKASRGKYLVFVSGHVLPTDESWLANLLAPFKDEKVAMVYGRQRGTPESKFSEQMDFKRLFGTGVVNSRVPLNYANNANSAIRKKMWEDHPFDEYLFGLEDIAWAREVAESGYSIRYEPTSAVYHIHNEKWSQVFNRYRREAIAAVRIHLKEPPQAKLSTLWLGINVVRDLLCSFPNYTDGRIEEILRFRYYQWKGSRVGWFQGNGMSLEAERNSNLFFPVENQSVVIQGPLRAVLKETPLPPMLPGDILIKVEYVGVCRTDIEVYEGSLGYYRDGHAKYPIVPGHEFSGTIARVGSNNRFQERFKVGGRVVGECILCRGEIAERKEVGVINVDGAYSRYIVVPGDSVHRIPEGVDTKTATLTEPLAVVLRALRRVESRLGENSRVAVVGAGQIGNLCTQVLAYHGHSVTLFDKDAGRLSLLKGKASEVDTAIRDLGRFDLIIEATGSKHALEEVLRGGRVDSTILLLGFPYGDIQYNFEDFVGQEKVIVGSVGSESIDFKNALALLPALDMKAFTEVVLPLEQFNEAWEAHKALKHLKILLKP